MVITLTLNPAFDVHCDIEDLKLYMENYADNKIVQVGGKGINITRALNNAKIENTAIVVLGNENSSDFIKGLNNDNINYKEITVEGKIRENITIHSKTTPETRISFYGFTAKNELLEEVNKHIPDKNSIITFTGKIPNGIDKENAIAFLKGLINNGNKVIVDSNSFTIDDLKTIKPFLIKPNEQEISESFKTEIDENNAHIYAKKLYECGISNVIISLGKNGMVYHGDFGAYKITVPKVDVVSTIGAGDSSLAGLIYGIEKNLKIEEVLKISASFGTAACMQEGTNPPNFNDILKIIEKTQIKPSEY